MSKLGVYVVTYTLDMCSQSYIIGDIFRIDKVTDIPHPLGPRLYINAKDELGAYQAAIEIFNRKLGANL